MLSATQVAGTPDSHFHTPSLDRWCEVYGVTATDPKAQFRQVVQAAVDIGTAGTDLFGLRLQRGSFDYLMQQLTALHPIAPTDTDRFAASFGKITYIHLTRRDKLDQAISYIKAGQSGLWHQASDGSELERTNAPTPFTYDRAAIAARMEHLTQLDTAWEGWFQNQEIRPYQITYDAFADDPKGTLAKLLTHLGQDPGRADTISIPTAKLADGISLDWADRFRRET